jgi:hypothetical protein
MPHDRILHLTLKRQWYDMIDADIKLEEYRELKRYWETRLGEDAYGCFPEVVEFRHGYKKDARRMRFEISDITTEQGRAEWGAEPGKLYFVIKLGKRI